MKLNNTYRNEMILTEIAVRNNIANITYKTAIIGIAISEALKLIRFAVTT